jgi:hypothetical protein
MHFTFLIPLVVRFLLAEGVKFLPVDVLKAKAKEWVYSQIGPDWLDPIVWGAVEAAWDVIMMVVTGHLNKVGSDRIMAESNLNVWQDVGQCSAEICKNLPQLSA